jgi:small acid-soluble spore protein K (minor)
VVSTGVTTLCFSRFLIPFDGGTYNMVRNKARNFPNQNNNKLEGEPRAKAEYASRRADGTINTHPQERMRASGERENDTPEYF